MASKRPFSEEDFTCPVCCDIFSDPVLLQCGHSVCKDCIQQYWTTKVSRECPLCRKRSTTRNPPVNLALKNLSLAFLNYRGPLEELCEVHRERLSLFCLHDEELMCVVCRESQQHGDHACRPVNEIAEERKTVFRREVGLLARKVKIIQDECNLHVEHIAHQLWHTENIIKKDFKHLHQLLYDEEKAVLNALNQEKNHKTQLMQDKIKKMSEEILSLSKTLSELRCKLDSGDIQFLQSFKDMLERAQNMNPEPEIVQVQRGLIDTAQYLGNLKSTVWSKIRRSISYTPVVFDPNTANSQLILSKDLTCVRDRDEQEEGEKNRLPDNPERFNRCPCVLGSVGYSSGTHIWDVDVEHSTFWMLGVTTESVKRKGTNSLPSEVWCIGYDSDTLSLKAPHESCIPFLGFMKPKRVRVNLDLDEGQLSFSDPLSKTQYHTFTTSYTEKVFPFFCSLCSVAPLRILPVDKHSI